jgi:glycosyltransferase involved in cell wall biosynthesis
MNNHLVISILIPNYNRGELLKETLDSCLAQTYPHWEALVVDDGSDDSSDSVGRAYAVRDKRITYEKRTIMPSGAPACRNQAFQKSRGEYVIFLDSDDLLTPFCLEQRLDCVKANPALDFLVFPMLMFKGNPLNGRYLWNQETEKPDLNRFLELDAVWQTTGPIWKRQAVEQIGGFTLGLACWQDVDFHLKALTAGLRYEVFQDLKPDVYYRQHETGSISQHEISSPAKMISRKEIFISNLNKFERPIDDHLKNSLRVFARNVTIGAIKSHYFSIAGEVMKEASKFKIFTARNLLQFYILGAFFALRLNKIGYIQRKMDDFIIRGRTPSSIGQFEYKPGKD